ncbi:uncharacterized protein LOC120355952 [Nilaparvata lugens]|uniref:uncharacterized protein LOC120355952 n=1 Tax=Nilaparvata lugens TaxID=108931 RepID=UPI00193E2F11|nr:uncharacterized protein LOC120355952 [Nilaparvata lugens]
MVRDACKPRCNRACAALVTSVDTIVVKYLVSCYLHEVGVILFSVLLASCSSCSLCAFVICVPLSFLCLHSFCMKMNDELLIECVRKYEFLYNLQHPKYMDATKKDVAWKDIEDQMKQPVRPKTLDSVDITSDEDNGDHDDHTVVDHTSGTETNAIIETVSDDVATDAQTVKSSVQNSKSVKRRFKNRTPQSASAVLMAKLLDRQNSLVPRKEPDELDRFFLNISDTVKKFSKYQQALVKNKVFSLVSEMELQLHSPAT